jgi:SAM-dependent methyltransferase
VDIALRWLVVAARRDALAGRTAQLVCANGEYLPFGAESFARALSLGTLEHCRDADRVAADSRRVLRRGGLLRVRTVNRYSLLPEPHVGVWGVGMVPRRWADRYVRWRNGQRYLHHRPLSPRELARGFRRAGFSGVRVSAAAMLTAERNRIGGAMQWAGPVYEHLRQVPIVGAMIRWVAPLLDARGVAA